MDAIPEWRRIGPKPGHWVEWQPCQCCATVPMKAHSSATGNLDFPVAAKNHSEKFHFQYWVLKSQCSATQISAPPPPTSSHLTAIVMPLNGHSSATYLHWTATGLPRNFHCTSTSLSLDFHSTNAQWPLICQWTATCLIAT